MTIEDAFRSGAALTQTGDLLVDNTIDGFDRVKKATDPLGNYVDTGDGFTGANPFLDPDGRVIRSANFGTIGDGGSTVVELARKFMRFDEGGRGYETQRDVFVASGVTLPSGRTITHDDTSCLQANSTTPRTTGPIQIYPMRRRSYVLTRNIFDPGGRTVSILADNASSTDLTYDGAGRMIAKRYLPGLSGDSYTSTVPVVGFTTAFDRANNKFYERALHAENRSSLYQQFNADQTPQDGYDSIDRLSVYLRGVLSATGGDGGNGGGFVTTIIALSGTERNVWRTSVFIYVIL